MMAAILNSAILDSAILHKKKLHSHFPPYHLEKKFTHWFWLNFMMPAILNSAMLDSDTAILDVDT